MDQTATSSTTNSATTGIATGTAAPDTAGSSSDQQQAWEQAVVAVYPAHNLAEQAVHLLERGGLPLRQISIIGRDWQLREEIQGYYRPADAAVEGAAQGAWVGGLFGLLWGFGLFLIPGAGPLLALGPLAGLLAGALGGGGIGALVSALMALGIPKDEALKIRSRVEAGEFLVVVQGTAAEIERAREILQTTGYSDIQTHTRPASQVGGQSIPAAA